MYSLTRGPSKLASKASQRGLTQQIEKFEGRVELTNRPFANGSTSMIMTSSPRPVFNGKKYYGRSKNTMTREPISPVHEDNVVFIAEAWQRVQRDLNSRRSRDDGPELYQNKSTANHIPDFEPFNIDEWWLNRTLHKTPQSP
ncbi:hypothetical protein NP493_709g03025 [Ridgeia piscesae]|uniref:MAPK regulated corepressor interacting protein 2-like n=1 Tax=Ridgeia piscesae TaxID=27915 RepID=A0AAD9KQS1_RIDPI|nr:hypothetical protein NP493_709g03025 [Ridgeia piscesae]